MPAKKTTVHAYFAELTRRQEEHNAAMLQRIHDYRVALTEERVMTEIITIVEDDLFSDADLGLVEEICPDPVVLADAVYRQFVPE